MTRRRNTAYRVGPRERVRLADFDPGERRGDKDDPANVRSMARDLAALARLQERLYAARTHSVLVVLQGIDTAGKDGTIRHVFSGVNPQGCRVASFVVPTEEEAAHDFLWRVHRQAPARGELVIFNRSHYEAVLVERVHGLVPPNVWRERYGEINAFESLLARAGTIVLKFFLHLSRREQKKRLEAREREPEKRWKADPRDWSERELWEDYRKAFEEALSKTSTRRAPWYVVASDHKWWRNLVIARTLVETLERFEDGWEKAIRERGEK